jgi:(R,R)-butanediol dehydrogenase / meso-butanediol dehydrogenase / diacetyl reductase
MKMAVLHGVRDLRLDSFPQPAIGSHDLLIKVAAAGICGTDLHFNALGPRFPNKPMPLGHEYAGKVIEVGAEVVSYRLGDRVAYNSNNSPADMGRGGEFGGFSDYVVLRDIDQHVQSLCKIPDQVSYDHAALVEPISVGAHAVNRADPKAGESVALLGAGPIGLGIIMALRGRGVDDIVVFDFSQMRLEKARQLGVRGAFDPRVNLPKETLGQLRGHGQIWGVPHPKTDIYFDTTGAVGLIPDIAAFCNKRSRIITIAIHREPLTLDATKIMSKEISLIGSQGYPSEFPDVMEKIASGLIDPELMISHRFPFNSFQEAFVVANDAAQAAKVVLTFDE